MLTHVNEEQRTLKPNIETQKAKYEQLNVKDFLSSNPRALLSYYHPNRNYINPLMPETFFPSNFEIQPKIGSHRLPTHRHGAHRIFF